jgi:hypothetical protein
LFGTLSRVGPWIAAALVLACLLLVILPRGEVRGRGLALLRCFFPSWRFFEEIAPGPALQISTAPGATELAFGPWRDAWAPAPRTATSLILNARGNLELAYQSLVDQLWSEVEEQPADPATSITYRLVRNLIELECLSADERTAGRRYRFRLTGAEDPDAAPFTSSIHVVEGP